MESIKHRKQADTNLPQIEALHVISVLSEAHLLGDSPSRYSTKRAHEIVGPVLG